MLDRLLEICGFSARLRLQPRHFEVDNDIDVLLAIPPEERLSQRSPIVEIVAMLGSPVVIVGAAAFVVHGVPLPVETLELGVGTTDDEVRGAIALLTKLYAEYVPVTYDDPLPSRIVPATITLPGRRRLHTPVQPVVLWPGCLAALRQRAVAVPVGQAQVWVAALSDLEPPAEDADLVRRYLDRLAARCRAGRGTQ